MTKEEASNIVKNHLQELVSKWDKTNLLDVIKNDVVKSNMSVLLESKPKQLVESSAEEDILQKAFRVLNS